MNVSVRPLANTSLEVGDVRSEKGLGAQKVHTPFALNSSLEVTVETCAEATGREFGRQAYQTLARALVSPKEPSGKSQIILT